MIVTVRTTTPKDRAGIQGKSTEGLEQRGADAGEYST